MSRVFASLITSQFARSGLLACVLLVLGQLPIFADQSVTLTWTPSPDTNAVGYKIYYGGMTGIYTNTILLGAETSVTVSGLTDGATYYFSATTVSASGAESAFSNEATYIIPASTNLPTGGTDTNSSPITAPALDPIANVTVSQNAGPQTVALTGISAGSGANATVNISVTSSDATIIPTPTIAYNGTDTTGTLTFAPATDAVGTATITVTLDNGGASNNLTSQTFTVTVATAVTVTPPPTVTQSPTLDALTNVVIYQNCGMQTVPLTGIASGITNGYSFVTIWAYTSDPTIIPAPTVNYTNPNSAGTLTFAPVADALGTATVTVKLNNGPDNITQTFTVTVVPPPVVNQAPTLGAISDLTIYQNAGMQTIPLSGITSGSTGEVQTLTVSAISSDPTIIPAPTVNYSSPNTSGTLTFAPVTNALGTAAVTITVNDGGAYNNTVTRTFNVTVIAAPVAAATGSLTPTVDPVANIVMIQGAASQNVTLTGITLGTVTKNQVLRISATSSNPRLFPMPTVRYASPASTGTLTLRPTPLGLGTATITVTLNNGGKSNNIVRQSFTVTVVSNVPPTLDPIADVTVVRNAGSQTVLLTGITSGSLAENQVLRVSAVSGNPRLLVNPTIQYGSPANTALLTFKPSGNSIGVATVTVTVNDGSRYNNSIRQRFTITVTAPATSSAVAKSSLVPEQDPAATLTTVAHDSDQFSFQVTGISGGKYVVQATSDLANWISVQTNTAPFVFQDTKVKGVGQRFYRALSIQ